MKITHIHTDEVIQTVTYIKNTFGFEVFYEPKKFISFFRDISPRLKREIIILSELSSEGYLCKIANSSKVSNWELQSAISLTCEHLVNSQIISQELSVELANCLVDCFGGMILPSSASNVQPTQNTPIFQRKSPTKMSFKADEKIYRIRFENCNGEFIAVKNVSESEKIIPPTIKNPHFIGWRPTISQYATQDQTFVAIYTSTI